MCDCSKNCESTKEKVLHCACELFATKGYKETTIQDICSLAGSNIASVNYHFGSKENLYSAAWKHAFELSNNLGGKISDDLPGREWLSRMIDQRIRVLFDDGPAGYLPRLIHKEHHEPSEMLEQIRCTIIHSFHERITKKIKEIIGDTPSPIQLQSATALVMGMMPGLLMFKHHYTRTTGKNVSETDKQEIIRTAQQYVLGGLDALAATSHQDTTL